MKLGFSAQIFGIYSDIKYNNNPSIGSRAVPYGRTDGNTQTGVRKPVVAFRSFPNVPKIGIFQVYRSYTLKLKDSLELTVFLSCLFLWVYELYAVEDLYHLYARVVA
jgi:hypothetical protein